MSGRLAGILLPAALLSGCARIEPPPGGPPDITPPSLIAVTPDSGGTFPGFRDEAAFQFNEVVSEGSTPSLGLGTSDLERLILLSPSTRVPDVRWKRDRITVKPREGWQPGRTYRVELLPGVVDLRRNRLDSGTVVTFTTGGPLPSGALGGTVLDWVAGGPARQALVEAMLLPDSLPYLALTDSSGRFHLTPIPTGRYVVRAVQDQNNNRQQDGREAFDSVLTGVDTATTADLWIFPHDSVGPRLTSATLQDSATILVSLSAPLDPAQALGPENARVIRAADSVAVAVASVQLKTVYDSLRRAERPPPPDSIVVRDTTPAPADTLKPGPVRPPRDTTRARAVMPRPRPDSLRPPTPPVPGPPGAAGRPGVADSALRALLATRPALTSQVVVQVATPLTPGASYRIELPRIRNANGAAAEADASVGLQVPEPAAADTTRVPADSTAAPPDPGAVPRR